jgi:hypothetical protein
MPAWAQIACPRRALGLIPAGLLAAPAAAQPAHSPWFDPTQLPSYSGRLERWIANPAGAVDRGLFREGTQFVFASSEAEALMLAIEPGAPVCVWGIRARNAAVVLMLAWGKTDSEPASFVERPAWFVAHETGREALRLSGRILCPLLTPRGEGMGVILAEGGAIRLSVEAHRALGDMLKAGENIAAEGLGTRRGGLVALDARAIGKEPGSLQPVTQP